MRRSLLAVPLIVIGTVALAPSALATNDPFMLRAEVKASTPKVEIESVATKPMIIPVTPIAPTIKEYVIAEGDTLTKISQVYGIEWIRIWQKNTNLTNPDILNVGEKLVIPEASEILVDRPLPVPVVATVAAPVGSTAPAPVARPAIPGNGYDYGNCTFYAKTRRPDLPNFLGNADAWYYSASAQGFPVGQAPSPGAVAVAVSYMHVAFVEAVNGSQVLVSEMNYEGFGVVSQRWSDTSEWHYIY